jgi:hypothetical protein
MKMSRVEGGRLYPACWDDCDHDQHHTDPDISPCIHCGLLIEYRSRSINEPCFMPADIIIYEEPV